MKLLQSFGLRGAALAFAAAIASAPLCAAPPQPPPADAGAAAAAAAARVEAAARQFLSEQATLRGLQEPLFEINVATATGPAPPCATRPSAEALETRYLNRMRFALTCPGRDGWQRLWTVRAEVSAVVLVAAAAVPAQKPLAESDVVQERRRLPDLSEVLGVPDDAIGQVALRPLRAGQLLTPRLLAQPQLVRRGANVDIVARNGPVEVRAPGEALEAGRRGDVVRVRNTSTGRVIRARIVDAALVEPENMPGTSASQSRD
jgi:flagellar basal body P-ring formation protein FlgA